MNNNTAKELLELARHYEQFNINPKDIELLKKAAKELEGYYNVCEDIGEIPPNTYIKIESEEHSEYVQKLAFEGGFCWSFGFTDINHKDKPYLYFEKDMCITYGKSLYEGFIKEDGSSEIFVDMSTGVVSYSKQ